MSNSIADPASYASFFREKLSANQPSLLKVHALGGEMSMTELADSVGFKEFTGVNSAYGHLGRRISDEFQLEVPVRSNGKRTWIAAIVDSHYWTAIPEIDDEAGPIRKGVFRSYLHEEVIRGLHLAAMLSDEELEIALEKRREALATSDKYQTQGGVDWSGKVFFTYVWGAPGNPAWPLTFATKAARSHARAVLQEGDIVFTVGTRTDPTAPEHKGRVVGAYRVSDMEVNTRDYVDLLDEERRSEDAIDRFPYALHPLEVWEIAGQENVFSELVGPLTGRHHLQARDKVIELDALTAEPLLALERTPVVVVEPKTILGRGRVALKNSKLAPKHEGDFQGSFGHHEIWYVYVLALRDQRGKDLAFKIGYAHDPKKRRDEHNRPLATEVTGLEWHVALKQETSSEDDARTVEQALLNKYRGRCLESNGEIVSGVTVTDISLALASVLREA